MPRSRQSGQPPDHSAIVRSLGLDLASGHRFDAHEHSWSQVVYADRGTLAVESAAQQWVVPPHRALWLPAGLVHATATITDARLRTIYLGPGLSAALPPDIRVLDVRPLLRELIVEIVRIGMLLNDSEQHRCLSVVLTNQLARAPTAPVSLPMPADRRARRVADTVLAALDQDLPVSSFARGAGASARTIERLFTRETGLSFGRWRQQARIQHAVRRLAEGAPVTTVSLECGYSSTSAFVSMFKKALGTTPGKYLAGQDS